jgi:pSer/pThr/pTyr-binding forkhead associated (FHA) protein
VAGPSMLKIAVIEGPDAPASAATHGPRLSIGRLASCDLTLADAQVSRQHAAIVQEGDEFVLVDLESGNGTFLVGRPGKLMRHVLKDGDLVRLGHDVLKISILRAGEPTLLASEPTDDVRTAVTLTGIAAPRTIALTVIGGPDKGRVYKPRKKEFRIGRQSSCEVRLSDDGVSRIHATIKREVFGYAIYDENSTNGVEIGAQRVFFAKLEDGATVRVGDTELKVTISDGRADPISQEARSSVRQSRAS